jgi:uncharacterized protein YqhQ
MGKGNSSISKVLAYPGLMLQKLTTREPDYSQLEVAIKALKAAEGIDDKAQDVNEIQDGNACERFNESKEQFS